MRKRIRNGNDNRQERVKEEKYRGGGVGRREVDGGGMDEEGEDVWKKRSRWRWGWMLNRGWMRKRGMDEEEGDR